MRFKQRKNLLIVGNTLAPEYPPVNLVNLPTGMFHEIMQCAEPGHGERAVRAYLPTGLVSSRQISLRHVQVGTMGFFNLLLFLLLSTFVFGCGVFQSLYRAVLLFEFTLVVVVLPPSWQVVGA